MTKNENKLPDKSAGVPLSDDSTGNYQPQVDEINSTDGITDITSKKQLHQILKDEDKPLPSGDAEDYDDMPE